MSENGFDLKFTGPPKEFVEFLNISLGVIPEGKRIKVKIRVDEVGGS